MEPRARHRLLARSLWGLAMAITVAALVFLVLSLDVPQPVGAFGFRGYPTLLTFSFATVGLLVATHRPENPIGWILLVGGGVNSAVVHLSMNYAEFAYADDPAHPGGDIAAWVSNWNYIITVVAIPIVLLLFPDGRFSPRRRRLALGIVAAGIVAGVGLALTPGPLESFQLADNPFGIDASRQVVSAVTDVGLVCLALGLLITALSLGARLRRSTGEERAQLTWIAAAGLALGVAFFVSFVVSRFGVKAGFVVDALEVLVIVALAGIPAAIGVAILRYRLYDVDVVISRTVVFGVLAAFITLVYAAIVVGVGTLAGRRGDAVLSAVATAAVALAFQPVRRWANRFANRLVYGERASPYEVLSSFGRRVTEALGTEDVLPRMAEILAQGTGALRADIWLRVGTELRPAASWPEPHAPRPPTPVRAAGTITIPDADASSLVRHDGELLGALAITKPPSEPVTPVEAGLVEDLAQQAGLILRNAGLIADLRASRQRLVAAQDQERRKLERNLHDGAQQQLVALSVKLRILKTLIQRDPGRAIPTVDELQAEAQDAMENLRSLARGIYPPLLADQGLGAALRAQASKAAVPVEVSIDTNGRFGQDVEAAVYFSCLEALQNVAKYARATRARVSIDHQEDHLSFEVSDDGAGFDTTTTPSGTGIQGITDRLAALGGSLEVRSEPGRGTQLVGMVPLSRS